MRRALLSSLLLIGVLGAGCGSDDDETPDACLNGAQSYLAALGDAPGPVTLDGEVPISECLTQNQGGADLEKVGGAMVEAATSLNERARRESGGEATVQLGYLVGAAERGAEETGGIHTELLRRLEAAALFSPAGKPPPPPFDQQYEQGYAAGREGG